MNDKETQENLPSEPRVLPITNTYYVRQAKVRLIKNITEEIGKNTFELGRHLKELRETFLAPPLKEGDDKRQSKYPGWYEFSQEELGMSRTLADRIIKIYEQFKDRDVSSRVLNYGSAVLGLIAPESVPEEIRQSVIEKIESGEKVTVRQVRRSLREALERRGLQVAPTPSVARAQAREIGAPVQASDGNIYFGATPEEAKEMDRRRATVYGVRDACATINDLAKTMTAEEFLNYALPHQLWKATDEHHIEKASTWLNELKTAWEKR